MLKIHPHCPVCESQAITTYDNSSLAEDKEGNLDQTIYASAYCTDCRKAFHIQGTITWHQSSAVDVLKLNTPDSLMPMEPKK